MRYTGITSERAALVQSTLGVAMMFGRIGTGYLIDRIFATFVMVAVTIGGSGRLLELYRH